MGEAGAVGEPPVDQRPVEPTADAVPDDPGEDRGGVAAGIGRTHPRSVGGDMNPIQTGIDQPPPPSLGDKGGE